VNGQQNTDIGDTLQLRGIALAKVFWLSIYEVHIGAIRRLRLNRPCAAAMRPYVKLLWPLVIIIITCIRASGKSSFCANLSLANTSG